MGSEPTTGRPFVSEYLDGNPSKQIIGNIGLYYASYRLSKLGWNVVVTSRNTPGPDLVVISQDLRRRLLLQVKTLREKFNPKLILGDRKSPVDYFIFVRGAFLKSSAPTVYIVPAPLVNRRIRSGKTYYDWTYEDFKGKWGELANGL